MMTTDPIADLLTRIRNAHGAHRSVIRVPYSKIKEQISKILVTGGYLKASKTVQNGTFKVLELDLPTPDADKQITRLIRVSKPGRRVYAKRDEIPAVLSGRGMIIVSTSAGLMSGREARKRGLGGELICKVW